MLQRKCPIQEKSKAPFHRQVGGCRAHRYQICSQGQSPDKTKQNNLHLDLFKSFIASLTFVTVLQNNFSEISDIAIGPSVVSMLQINARITNTTVTI